MDLIQEQLKEIQTLPPLTWKSLNPTLLQELAMGYTHIPVLVPTAPNLIQHMRKSYPCSLNWPYHRCLDTEHFQNERRASLHWKSHQNEFWLVMCKNHTVGCDPSSGGAHWHCDGIGHIRVAVWTTSPSCRPRFQTHYASCLLQWVD